MTTRPTVVIVGGGFGGLQVARKLCRSPVDIELIDRRNFHLFQPLLYQVATGGLSPANIAAPLRSILAHAENVTVRQGDVIDFDVSQRAVLLRDAAITYDYLIVASGSTHSYFGNSEWEAFAPGLKSVEDAVTIRGRVLSAFEAAENEKDAERRKSLMTFAIVGGGPTGVELAGALSELANYTLVKDFRRIDTSTARIILLEAADRLLTAYDPEQSGHAQASLEALQADVRLGAKVDSIKKDLIVWTKDGRRNELHAATILWGAGVSASPLGKKLAAQTNAQVDRSGRVRVAPDLSTEGNSDIFVLGDLACCLDEGGNALPGIAPVAMQQGAYVARLIKNRLKGKPTKPFRYRDYGKMAVIGRSAAVAEVGSFHFHGFVAWLFWLFVHLINLVEFQNRVLVLFQWAWNYLTRNRSARLITNDRQDDSEAPSIPAADPSPQTAP